MEQLAALDGVYRRTDGEPVIVEVAPPSDEALRAVLQRNITRMLRMLTNRVTARRARPTRGCIDCTTTRRQGRPLPKGAALRYKLLPEVRPR